MGTGCDTIMAQIAADCLNTPMDNIVVFSVDTDISRMIQDLMLLPLHILPVWQ